MNIETETFSPDLLHSIDTVSTEFKGQLDDLYKVVGMLVIGQLYGWRVMRLVASRSVWTRTIKLFGDPKLLMPERGRLAHKSLGLKAVDAVDAYWDVIKGVVKIPKQQKAGIM